MSASHSDWIDRHCICATCSHGVDRDLFGKVFCDRSDSMAGGWNPATARCEEHDFAAPALAAELEQVMDYWYRKEYANRA